MKSKIKIGYIIYQCLIIILCCGLVGGFLFDLKETLPIGVKIILLIVLIGYPFFVIYSFLKIPKIEITEDKIISTSMNSHKEIWFNEIYNISPKKFINTIYSIGDFYSVQSTEELTINIPYKMYSNEKELLQLVNDQFLVPPNINP